MISLSCLTLRTCHQSAPLHAVRLGEAVAGQLGVGPDQLAPGAGGVAGAAPARVDWGQEDEAERDQIELHEDWSAS